MITGDMKSRIGRIWDTMWSGGISNPITVMEQLTYLLFIKRLDELHTLKEHQAARTKQPIEEPIFEYSQNHLRWSYFREMAPDQMFATVRDEVFPFIKTLGKKSDSDGEGGSTYTQHMRDALFLMPTPKVLANVVDQLDNINMSDADTKGDLYEYMLGKIATAGQNGQFRTPRHIIEMMVEMTAPNPKDVICDPACGTAGFLIEASKYLRKHYRSEIYRDEAARRRFNEDTFHGYDFDSTMLRIGSMNMLLHGAENPDIRYKDSLEENDENDAEKYSLILANPPFTGSLDYESTAKDLLRTVKTKKTELLFLALFQRLLKPGGRAAAIVPAGVLEADSKAHASIRSTLIEKFKLEAVIKLPHWVFKPYASVDTSIIIFSKGGATDSVLFYNVENDGFADDAQKTPVLGSDLPEVVKLWKARDSEERQDNPRKHRVVSAEEIRKNNYDLCPPMYLSGHKYPDNSTTAELGEFFDIVKGSVSASTAKDEGDYPFITSSITPKRTDSFSFEGPAICVPTVSATGHGHASIKAIHLVEEERFDASSITAVLLPKNKDVPVSHIFYYLLAHKNDLLIPLMRGATNKSININRLSEVRIPQFNENSSESRAIQSLVEIKASIIDAEKSVKKLKDLHKDKLEALRKMHI